MIMKTTKDCYTKDGKFCSFAENFECTAPDESFCSVLEDAKCTNKKGKIPQKEATGTLKRLLDETKKEREFISVFTAYMYHPNTDPDIILACCEKLLSIAKEAFIESACRCYCNDICEKGMTGMCFYKHNGQGQVKKDFKYNECNELKLIINEMEKETYESE